MKKKSFTFTELLITMLILAILAALSITAYAKTVEQAREKTCIQNQLLIKTLLDNYISENSVAPTSLAAIPEDYFIKALAKLEKDDPLFSARRNLYCFIIHPFTDSIAYAQTPPSLLAFSGVKRNFLICPMDKRTNPTQSYALTDKLYGSFPITIGGTICTSVQQAWNALLNSTETIIIDSDTTAFTYTGYSVTAIATRHTHMFGNATGIGIKGDRTVARYGTYGYPAY